MGPARFLVDGLVMDDLGWLSVVVPAIFCGYVLFKLRHCLTFVGPDEAIVVVNLLKGVRRELHTGFHILLPLLEDPVSFSWTHQQTIRGQTETRAQTGTR